MSSSLRAALRRTVARACGLAAGGRSGLRVLTYHRVNDSHPHDRLSVRSEAFAAQMKVLAESGRPVVALERALPALRGEVPLPEGAVALTFDDGYEDNASVALPILERFEFPATFFVVTGLMGSEGTLPRYQRCCSGDGDGMMSWDQVRSLRAAGHDIGGHGRAHLEMAGLSLEEAREEAESCALDLELRLAARPRLFCYPRGSQSPAVRTIVRGAGFEAACTVQPGGNLPGIDPLGLRRTEISGQDTLQDFRLKLAGGFDAWHRLVQQIERRRAS